jgi:heptosyltransferase-2
MPTASNPTNRLPWSVRFRLFRRRVEHGGRNLLLKALRAFLSHRSASDLEGGAAPRSAEERANIRRILIVRTGRPLGDALMALVLVPECRRLFPDVRVDLLFRDNLAGLFRHGAGVDQVLELCPRVWFHPLAFVQLMRALRLNRYDLVIACDQPFKSSFTTLALALFTRARWRVGFSNDESRGFLTVPVEPVREQPMVWNLLNLLSAFGEPSRRAIPRLQPPPGMDGEVARFLGNGRKPVLIFVPGHWRKSWPLENFISLARELTRRQQEVVLAFGPGDDRHADAAVRSWCKDAGLLGRVLPAQRLGVFAALLASCRLFISNDCGPYHLAVAVGTPCVAAFLSADNRFYFGYEEPGRLVALHDPDPAEAERKTLQAALQLIGVS